MRAELSEGTDKGTLRRTLVQHGWDEDEAILFIEQIAAEMARDQQHVRSTPEWYEQLMRWMALILMCGVLWYVLRPGCVTDANIRVVIDTLVTGSVLIWSLCEWLLYRKRLKRLRTDKTGAPAVSFQPTKGILQITERCRTRQELTSDILVAWRIIALLLMVVGIVFLLIYGLIFH